MKPNPRRSCLGVTFLAATGLILGGCASDRSIGDSTRVPLPTGRYLEGGFAEASAGIGSMPVNLVTSPDGRYAITTGAGTRQWLCAIATADGKLASHLVYKATALDPENGLYYGLTFGPDGTLYAAQGAAGGIATLKLSADGVLTESATIRTSEGTFPAGLSADSRGILYVTNNDPGSLHNSKTQPAFEHPGSLLLIDTKTKKQTGQFTFESESGTTNYPLAVSALPDGSKAYVASQRDGAVYVLDTHDPAAVTQRAVIPTGAHPDSLLLNKSGKRLYVANAHSDTISIVDTESDKVIGTVLLRPEIARDLAGATPTGLALSPHESTLYAALGDMNAVAVISLMPDSNNAAKLLGYLPAGWYPTAVAVTADAKHLLVTNAKGERERNPNGKASKTGQVSPLALLEGTATSVAVPAPASLDSLTQKVLENARLVPRYLHAENPLKEISRASEKDKKIKHVVYIVKENRTYDQVLGDLPQGNGDPARCLFDRTVTPNLHALAERFVLLDNFYDCGEVSGDGWTWSTQAQANEYVQRNVPYEYSGHSHNFDYEGTNNAYPTGGFPATGPDGKPLSSDPRFKNGAKPITDVAEAPGGHLWDLARKAGLSYRNYGFFVGGGIKSNGRIVIPENYPSSAGLQPGGHDLDGVTDVDYRHFDLDYADSEAPQDYAKKNNDNRFLRIRRTFGKYEAPSRFTEWNREFQMMLQKDPAGNAVPALMTVRFGDDHTVGATAGKPTPKSMVADNDYAVGQLVQAVSNSPIWDSTAIFVIEDDAQNGPDHVDAHRSTCYVISPWIRKESIDHTFQNTVSVLKTMELLLNLGPMCQYDAASAAILDFDSAPANAAPFEAILPSAELVGQLNPGILPARPKPVSPEQSNAGQSSQVGIAALAEASAKMDFVHADHAPADELNRIIWKSIKGVDSEMPPTPHRPVLIVPNGDSRKHDDDDD